MKKGVSLIIVLALAFVDIATGFAAQQTNRLETLAKLGLQKLDGRIAVYYSDGAKTRAHKLQAAFSDMMVFYEKELEIHVRVPVAILSSNDWAKVNDSGPYGLPNIRGEPQVILLPATSGGLAFQFVMGRKDAIPAALLRDYLETNQTTFEAAADEFVDMIGFHELGHALCDAYSIDPKCNWLGEYVASYFGYAFISERRAESRKVFDLLGRPSKVRPNNTTLADFERLYSGVDDYGWYQGMFESHIQRLYPKMGLQFLKELHERFPADAAVKEISRPDSVSPEQVVAELEKFAPGFENWARGFQK